MYAHYAIIVYDVDESVTTDLNPKQISACGCLMSGKLIKILFCTLLKFKEECMLFFFFFVLFCIYDIILYLKSWNV